MNGPVNPALLDRLRAALGSRYAIERELGAGGMATVYVARDLRHERPVALKVLRPELASALGFERFLTEIRLTANLQHPHILPLFDSGEADGLLYYVMPLVEGESLRTRLDRVGQFSLDQALDLTRQVAAALEFAHGKGIVHRDIKPENILLAGSHVLVADFGIALALSTAGGPRLTQSGLLVGTPAYMSPEQAGGARDLDGRSDQYSLACMVYEMLAGQAPFTATTPQALLARHMLDPVAPLRTIRPSLPPHVDAALQRALSKAPADRFDSVAEFAVALATPIPAEARAGRWAKLRQRPWRIALSAGVATLVGVGILLGIWHPWRRSAQATLASQKLASVAVLPFDNLSSSTSDSYLTDGITDEIIGQLAQVGGLKVISRTSSVALKGTHLTLRQVAETLGVRHILEGSVRHDGIKIRVTVDLIDANTDAHVWVANYDRDLTSILGVQQDIARHVADTLGSMVGLRPTTTHLARTEKPNAYEAYLRGRSLMYQRTPESLLGARDQFLLSIAHDSTYAPAYAGLASVYSLWGSYSYGGMDLYDVRARAIAMADRAIRLDPDLAEAYASRGSALNTRRVPGDSIEADFEHALALRPNSAEVHQWHANFLTSQGRSQDALAEVERAIRLDPLAPGTRVAFAAVALGARRFDLAAQQADQATALQPNLRTTRELWALAQLLSGHPDRCATRDLGVYRGLQAMCLYSLGERGKAAQIADSVRAAITNTGPNDITSLLPLQQLAEYSAWIGDAAASLSWLEQAYAISPGGEDPRNFASGIYDKVQNSSLFQAGLKRIHDKVDARLLLARRSVKGL